MLTRVVTDREGAGSYFSFRFRSDMLPCVLSQLTGKSSGRSETASFLGVCLTHSYGGLSHKHECLGGFCGDAGADLRHRLLSAGLRSQSIDYCSWLTGERRQKWEADCPIFIKHKVFVELSILDGEQKVLLCHLIDLLRN